MEMRGRIHSLEVEKMECEYRIRQEVCRELQDQITEIEEAHRSERERERQRERGGEGGREGVRGEKVRERERESACV